MKYVTNTSDQIFALHVVYTSYVWQNGKSLSLTHSGAFLQITSEFESISSSYWSPRDLHFIVDALKGYTL